MRKIIYTDIVFLRDLRFERLSALALNYPYFKGRDGNHIGNITFKDCSFSVLDELDGERSLGKTMVKEHVENVTFVNTFFTECDQSFV